MFGLFKRTKVEFWEVEMLKKVLGSLDARFINLKQQIDEGLLNRVLLNNPGMTNYVGFTYVPQISKKFEDKLGKYFIIKGIEVFNLKTNNYTPLELHISYGLVSGYATPEDNRFLPDLSRVNMSNLLVEFLEQFNEAYEKLKLILTKKEILLINSLDVYEFELHGKKYIYVKDITDGNFLAIDSERRIYEITHDHLEITRLEGDIVEIFKKNTF
jgi:hypothetical protein